ncbi:MAG: hypothetical protein R3301_08565, partial [Saprospiraceae bacterium]|nr:hypothetical protein [Saprospiraceae bacterium]
MKQILAVAFLYGALITGSTAQEFEPLAPRPAIDTFFGQTVEDPYRFLEDMTDPATREWLDAQREAGQRVLTRCLNKVDAFTDIDKLSYVDFDLLTKDGDYYFYVAY